MATINLKAYKTMRNNLTLCFCDAIMTFKFLSFDLREQVFLSAHKKKIKKIERFKVTDA